LASRAYAVVMPSDPADPTVIRSLAVTAADVVAAVEADLTSDRETVLRVTPPFSGRMRARLHVRQEDESERSAQQLHVPPERLLEPDPPQYPRPSETEDTLRSDPDREYTVETHHEYHVERVEEWRAKLRKAICNRAAIETQSGRIDVEIHVLG
jgi:hypothetical protein